MNKFFIHTRILHVNYMRILKACRMQFHEFLFRESETFVCFGFRKNLPRQRFIMAVKLEVLINMVDGFLFVWKLQSNYSSTLSVFIQYLQQYVICILIPILLVGRRATPS